MEFSTPQLCDYGGDTSKPWFVWFDATDDDNGQTVRKQFRGGINYYHDAQGRTRAGEQLKKYWKKRLESGWSPFSNSPSNGLGKMKFPEALDYALEKCVVAKKTKLDYSGTVEFVKEAAKKCSLANARISGIKRQHILLVMDKIKEDRKWTNHAYNKNLGYLSGIMTRLVKYQVIESNPAHGIEPLTEAESSKFETLTEREKIIIRNHLTTTHPAFFTFLMVVYYAGIRPKEALALRVSDLQLDKNMILIKPDLDEENSKTKSIRMVAVDVNLLKLLQEHTRNADPGDFVFGGIVGKVGSKKGARQTGYFMPSPLLIKRDTATKLWKAIVMDELKIKKYMYALKHTGGDDKILAGISIDALQEMYGHKSKFMTEKYIKSIKKVYAAEIIEKSKAF